MSWAKAPTTTAPMAGAAKAAAFFLSPVAEAEPEAAPDLVAEAAAEEAEPAAEEALAAEEAALEADSVALEADLDSEAEALDSDLEAEEAEAEAAEEADSAAEEAAEEASRDSEPMTAEEAAAAAPEAPETTAPPAAEAAEATWAETMAARARTAVAENCIVMCVFMCVKNGCFLGSFSRGGITRIYMSIGPATHPPRHTSKLPSGGSENAKANPTASR